jgi:hypothetical protein
VILSVNIESRHCDYCNKQSAYNKIPHDTASRSVSNSKTVNYKFVPEGRLVLGMFRLGAEGKIFTDCSVPPGKPIRRKRSSILFGNGETGPAIRINDMGSRTAFKHGFEKKPLRPASRQRTGPVSAGIEKHWIAAAGQPSKFVSKSQADRHEPFGVEFGNGKAGPTYRACHCDALSTQSNRHADFRNDYAGRNKKGAHRPGMGEP